MLVVAELPAVVEVGIGGVDSAQEEITPKLKNNPVKTKIETKS